MAKVIAPLLSLSASGEFGKAIVFVCGQFARKRPVLSDGGGKGNPVMMEKFRAGAEKWQEWKFWIKDDWSKFYKTLLSKELCAPLTYDLSGYDMWMLYWLKFGEGGWPDYPYPGEPPAV